MSKDIKILLIILGTLCFTAIIFLVVDILTPSDYSRTIEIISIAFAGCYLGISTTYITMYFKSKKEVKNE